MTVLKVKCRINAIFLFFLIPVLNHGFGADSETSQNAGKYNAATCSSHSHASESAEILKTIKQLKAGYKEGSADKLFESRTSMKGMSLEELKTAAREDARQHKGFDYGQAYSEVRIKIDQDLAIAFCREQKAGPLFLKQIRKKWKIILDWSLPNPVGTTYPQETVDRMRELHKWYRGKCKFNN